MNARNLVLVLVVAAAFAAGVFMGRGSMVPALSSLPIEDSTDPDIRTLHGLQHRLAASLAPLDSVALDSIMADDMRAINAGDQVLDKAAALSMLRGLSGALVNVVDDSIAVRRYGDVAVMTLRETVTLRGDTGAMVGRLRMTVLWFKRDGRWQAVASQAMIIR